MVRCGHLLLRFFAGGQLSICMPWSTLDSLA